MQYLFYADVLPMTKLAIMNNRCQEMAAWYPLDLRRPTETQTGEPTIVA